MPDSQVDRRGPVAARTGALEVACDESGSEGENLIGGNTDVFAHASVRVEAESAADCISELRSRIRSPATEYKANHLLREKHRPVLKWILGPQGPLYGNAHVQLVDKSFFVVGKVVDLLVGEPAMAGTLYREGPAVFGPDRWAAFLAAGNNLMRSKTRPEAAEPVAEFFALLDVLRLAGPAGGLAEALDTLLLARPRAESFRAGLFTGSAGYPALDPLIPAIIQTITHWGNDGQPVSIVHDRQRLLTEERIAQLRRDSPHGALAGFRLVGSFADARVQLADFLAGVARKIASEELNNRGDAELTALLRSYVDSCSIWGDDRSWRLLSGENATTRVT